MARRGGDTAHFAQCFHAAQRTIEVGQHARIAVPRDLNFGGAGRGASCKGDDIVVRNGEAAAGIGPIKAAARQPVDHVAHAPVESDPSDTSFAADVVLRVNGAFVGIPHNPHRAEVPAACKVSDVRSVTVHNIEIVVLVGAACIVEAEIGNQASVWRSDRLPVRTVAVG